METCNLWGCSDWGCSGIVMVRLTERCWLSSTRITCSPGVKWKNNETGALRISLASELTIKAPLSNTQSALMSASQCAAEQASMVRSRYEEKSVAEET
jgi:hypothetical protein